MSKLDTNEDKLHEVAEATKGPYKCRIPLHLAGRQKPAQNRPKTTPTKSVVLSSQQPRIVGKPGTRSRSGEKSAIPKRVTTETPASKAVRPVIMVPVSQSQKQTPKTMYTNRTLTCLPDQETINRHEDLEIKHSDLNEGIKADFADIDSISSRNERVTQLKISWQEDIVLFEKLKNELHEKQRAITELYANMGNIHKKMTALGQKASLPPSEELQIMNIANLTPEQLLRLCTNGHFLNDSQLMNEVSSVTSNSFQKLYNIPSKLTGTCEQILNKNKEIVNDLEMMLATPEKQQGLKMKISEFNAENEMLASSFEKIKNEFILELNCVVSFIRNSVKERMTLHLQNDKIIRDMSELTSQKDDLRKQLYEAEHRKSYVNRSRIEELEKQLKEEICKNNLLKNRLARTTGQVKINVDHAAQLSAALEQARSKCRSLERTVQDLKDEKEQLHNDFEIEFNKFSKSIKENTARLEEIAEARKKLEAEKEDLEQKLADLSSNYNESIKNMKQEMNLKIAKVIENERKYEDEKEERLKLVDKVECLCSQLLESELRYKDMCKQLQEREIQLNKAMDYRIELETMKERLAMANEEIAKYRDKFNEQNEAIKEIELNLRDSLSVEENMKSDLRNKEEYAAELEKKVALLEEQQQENENKMISYEEQLSTLKQHLTQLQDDFGEFESLSDLHEMINQQRSKLHEATRQNDELVEMIQKKDIQIEQHLENIAEQENNLEQRDAFIRMLSEKEEEHANIIKLLRNNLEMRSQADIDLNQQLSDKNSEIESLITNLDTRKKQIDQLEKIIFTLEDQTRKASAQRRKDQEKIKYLENKLNQYEIYHIKKTATATTPTENLDDIIKILEEELISPLDPKMKHLEEYFGHKSNNSDKVGNKISNYSTGKQDRKSNVNNSYVESIPTKIVVGYRNDESYSRNIHDEMKCENLDRQKGIINIQTQKWTPTPDPMLKDGDTPPITENAAKIYKKSASPTRNIHFLAPIQLRDDKKCLKLLKIAGHRL